MFYALLICVCCSIVCFIVSIHYLSLYEQQKKFADDRYKKCIRQDSDYVDCCYGLTLYKKVYDKYKKKFDESDFDVTYCEKYLKKHKNLYDQVQDYLDY